MSKNLVTPQDPRSQYRGPPSSVEVQPAPATQQAMSEKPDCGETSYQGSGRLAGRKALLTGADSGIGRAAAIAYAREGADVAFGYLPAEQKDAEEVARYIREAGRKAVLLPGDISQEGFCKELVGEAVKQLGGLDILVNNAGKMGKDGRPAGDHHRALRLADEDQHLLLVLDHQGRGAAPQAGRLHHQYHQRAGLLALRLHLRLRAHQGRHRQLHQGAEAVR